MHRIYIFALMLILAVSLSAKKKGAPPMTAGAPGDRTCLTSKCHAGNDLNSEKATIKIEGLPKIYTPGEIYIITLQVEQTRAKAFGFQATVADANGKASGRLTPSKNAGVKLLDDAKYKSRTDRQYLTHIEKSTKALKKGVSQQWAIQWVAPESPADSSTFYFAFNAGNGNKKTTGDYIYTRSVVVPPATE